jgi:hypothetical protein
LARVVPDQAARASRRSATRIVTGATRVALTLSEELDKIAKRSL